MIKPKRPANPHLINMLKNTQVFSAADDATIAEIAVSLKKKRFKAGESVFNKGDVGSSMFVIVEGTVSVHDGEHRFGTLGPSDVFGEYSLIDEAPRSASVTAETDLEVLLLNQKKLFKIIKKKPDMLGAVFAVFTERLRKHNALEEALAKSNALISAQYQELEHEKKVIETQNDEIKSQNDEIARQRNLLFDKNTNITASMNYARRIQEMMLPEQALMEAAFHEFMVLYKPKDIVSGDFYWFCEKWDKIFVAAIDCTGHGVPGALISIAGNTLLNQIVKDKNITDANRILDDLNLGVKSSFKKTGAEISEGMDVAICVIDKKAGILEFAGAGRPLLYFKDKEMTVLKGDKRPIGEGGGGPGTGYTRHVVPLASADMSFYLFSDGFQDQFNLQGEKYMSKKLRKFLASIHELPMIEQHQTLDNEITKWMEGVPQIDDILVMGFKC